VNRFYITEMQPLPWPEGFLLNSSLVAFASKIDMYLGSRVLLLTR